jgi:hypothetical protein
MLLDILQHGPETATPSFAVSVCEALSRYGVVIIYEVRIELVLGEFITSYSRVMQRIHLKCQVTRLLIHFNLFRRWF